MKQISNCLKVLVLIFLFNQCEKDTEYIETAPETGRHSNFKVNTVSAKQLSKITGFLASKNINLLQKDTIAGAVFDTDNIIEVIDELNTTNYSLRFVYPDTPEHVFYNLVVGTDGQGNYNTPYVLKYECDASQLEAFVASNYNFHYFKGSISHHRFTDFFQNDDLFSKTTADCTQFDQYGDPLACEETSIDGSGPSGSGGSTAVGNGTTGETVPGTGSPGGNGGFSITVYHIIPSGDWYVFGPGSVCQHPGECEIVIAMNGQDEQQRTASECPPCTLPTGGVGVSTDDADEDEEIIIDSSFKNTKAECVYNKLKSLNGTFFSTMITNAFESSKEAHIKFEVGDIPADEDYTYKARTYPSYNGNGDRYFRIKLDTDFVNNASTIEIALALIHETVHAELLERCIQLGLILNITPNGSYTFQNHGNPTILNNLTIFNAITTYYKNLGGGNPQWNHDQFNIFGLRENMAQNLMQIHPWLDNISDSFVSYINSDPVINSVQEAFDNLAWEGLELTQEYLNLTPEQKSKKEYTVQQVKSHYTHDCN